MDVGLIKKNKKGGDIFPSSTVLLDIWSITDLKCEDCKVGYYQDQKGFPSCSKCIPGEYQKEEGKEEVSGGGVCLSVITSNASL